MLTSPRLSDLFDTPVAVDVVDGYVFARPGTKDAAAMVVGDARRS